MNARRVAATFALPAVLAACGSGGGLSSRDQAICDRVKAARRAPQSGDAARAFTTAVAAVAVAARSADNTELRLAATNLAAKAQQAGDQPVPPNDPDMNKIRRICGVPEVS